MNGDNSRILLVEDDVIIALSETKILKKYGFTVEHTTSGEDCLEILRAGSQFDLILMDIDLGSGMDGIEASQIIANEYNIPIIFLSSHTEPEIIQKTERITSYGYIPKNSGETVLIASINMAFRLRESNLQYQLLFENSKEAILLADDTGKFIKINQAAMDLLELDADNFHNFRVADLKLLGDVDPGIRYQNYIEKGQEVGTIEIQSSNGDVKIAEYYAFRIAPNLHQSILKDITYEINTKKELEKSIEEKTILMNELQHRVRNSFSLISSLISLEKSNSYGEETNRVLEDLLGRIQSLTKLYDILLRSESNTSILLNEYINHIIESLRHTYINNSERIRIEYALSECNVTTKDATSWGLITNELVTNSLKYAFKESITGTIYVYLYSDKDHISLKVSDTGNGPGDDFSLQNNERIGLGLTLVKLLSRQLKGVVEYVNDGRATFQVTCPRVT